MDILSEVYEVAKQYEWKFAYQFKGGNVYVFRDRNLLDTKKIDIDELEYYYTRHGEHATRVLIEKYFA